jgi:hypothetical protein
MSTPTRVVVHGPKTHSIEYSLFISITAIIAIAILDATGGSVVSLYAMVADALVAVAT